MSRKRQDIVGILDEKVTKLREEEAEKEAELKELSQELKKYELALDSLRGNAKEKRGRAKRETQDLWFLRGRRSIVYREIFRSSGTMMSPAGLLYGQFPCS